ncbi:PAS-domain containing protein [Salipiger mangrovisoli]|uniref:PAS-domain containing protein n=1 Tax=Salipiger mangrovisoli TaxID=2865933 RepID=A0ABR9WXH7_9RHOB|nr:PAS-domain containing protein [Salipiger mangrovisoli]MBE9635993.1 PAS-domain containing protein [Salipiger mangrovisoli]
MELTIALAIGIGAGVAAFFGSVFTRAPRAADSPERVPPPLPFKTADTEILLIGDRVAHMTQGARSLLDLGDGELPDWATLRHRLEPFFGPLPDAPPQEAASFAALNASGARLFLLPEGTMLRLHVQAGCLTDGQQLRMIQDQADTPRLQRAIALVPCPIWQSDEAQRVTWYNAAYEDACAQVGAAPTGPAPFDLALPDGLNTQRARIALGARGEDSKFWYEVQSHRNRDGWMHFATNIDAIIRSEVNQRNFLQTLTRIFAHLPIGLAIFDRDRRLVLFNPALIDLTGLSAEFLSSRPNLMSLFDTLREGRMMPEPKNYQSWREHLSGVIAAASSDLYVETWDLPSGLTYRITGRPHPDCGIAFLFEDISSEISLTRRFRQELEQAHFVLDCHEEAIAVFSNQGGLSFCNEAYTALWSEDPDSCVAELSVTEATARWQAACAPSPIWGDIRDFALSLRDRAAWEAPLHMLDGRSLLCRVVPMPGGATLLRFSVEPEMATASG